MSTLFSVSPLLIFMAIAILLLIGVFFIDIKIGNSCIAIIIRAAVVALALFLLYSLLFK